jgi:DNA-binding LytR/AlgR family response regulator
MIFNVTEIDWVEPDGDYVSVHVGAKSWLLRETIAAAGARPALSGFMRLYHSTLVNINRVRALLHFTKREITTVPLLARTETESRPPVCPGALGGKALWRVS